MVCKILSSYCSNIHSSFFLITTGTSKSLDVTVAVADECYESKQVFKGKTISSTNYIQFQQVYKAEQAVNSATVDHSFN
jgi:hypothetical protein